MAWVKVQLTAFYSLTKTEYHKGYWPFVLESELLLPCFGLLKIIMQICLGGEKSLRQQDSKQGVTFHRKVVLAIGGIEFRGMCGTTGVAETDVRPSVTGSAELLGSD